MLITLLSVSFYASAIELTINSALIKATKPGQTVTAGFMKIKSPTTLNIKNISTPVAEKIEVHTMKMEKYLTNRIIIATIYMAKELFMILAAICN